jgi:hypothetical protein
MNSLLMNISHSRTWFVNSLTFLIEPRNVLEVESFTHVMKFAFLELGGARRFSGTPYSSMQAGFQC